MGQYWRTINLDKKEWINCYPLGAGAKLWEQVANSPSIGTALQILIANMPEARGGGDLDMDSNWHGRERTFPEHNCSPADFDNENYPMIAQAFIGRWAGDRIITIGDYAENGDFDGLNCREYGDPEEIYGLCYSSKKDFEEYKNDGEVYEDTYKDISPFVALIIEHELQGKYVGEGWKNFKYDHDRKRNKEVALALRLALCDLEGVPEQPREAVVENINKILDQLKREE